MSRRLGVIAAALCALVLLAGCNLAARVVVQPDGSGYYSVIMAVPNAASNPGKALLAAVRRAAATSNVPLSVASYSANGSSGAKMTFHFLSLADLNSESQRLAASGKGGIGVTITRGDQGWHFSASTSSGIITPPGSSGPSSNALRSTINSVFNIALVVQLPGAPAANNASAVSHTATASTFTWSLSSAQAADLEASTTYVGNQANVKLATGLTPVASASSSSGSSGGSGSGWSGGMVALVAGGAVIVLGAGAFFVVRRRQAGATLQAAPVQDSD